MIFMTKIDIFSGFLGAGKTTLIKKLIKEAYGNEKVVLIENEFGEIGIDGGFLQEAGINITEMNSGCICCSLVGDFREALSKVIDEFSPDRVIIEPSGVGKLSDVIKAVEGAASAGAQLNGFTTVVDAKKCKMYTKNFGEFFNNQIENASTIVLSHTSGLSEEKLAECVEIIRAHNQSATVITTDWDKLTGAQILEAAEQKDTLAAELERLKEAHEDECDDPDCECHHHHDDDRDGHHHHHHHDHDEDECHDHEHHHHHDDEDECHDHEHHHHHDDEDECHDHEHHHHHDDEDECHDHEHHHHHHHADEVFASWGVETTRKYTKEEIESILDELDSGKYGIILRAKGIVEAEDGNWIHYDFVPGEKDVRNGCAGVTGRICVIGSKIDEDGLSKLFNV